MRIANAIPEKIVGNKCIHLQEMTQGIPELGGKVEESDEGEDNAEDEAEEAGFSKETKPKTK